MKRKIPPTHPGEVLREEFLKPMALSQSELARKIRVNPRRINELANEKRGHLRRLLISTSLIGRRCCFPRRGTVIHCQPCGLRNLARLCNDLWLY